MTNWSFSITFFCSCQIYLLLALTSHFKAHHGYINVKDNSRQKHPCKAGARIQQKQKRFVMKEVDLLPQPRPFPAINMCDLSQQIMSAKPGETNQEIYQYKSNYQRVMPSLELLFLSQTTVQHVEWGPHEKTTSGLGDVCSQTHLSAAWGGGRKRYHLLVPFLQILAPCK